jgi:hypothetical protein
LFLPTPPGAGEDLAGLVRALADLMARADSLELVLVVGGKRVRLSVSEAGAAEGEGEEAADAGPLSHMEECVIEALGGDTLTGQQIALKAGYPYDASLRQCLAAMRRRGILGGRQGVPGYWVID